MCCISGFVKSGFTRRTAFQNFFPLLERGFERGRDGFGYTGFKGKFQLHWKLCPQTPRADLMPSFLAHQPDLEEAIQQCSVFIANHRAEPTTEFIFNKEPDDQQPYSHRNIHVVHNGTIANDKILYRAHPEWEPPTAVDSFVIAPVVHEYGFLRAVTDILQGSMAVACYDELSGNLSLYRNYQPIYLFRHVLTDDVVFSSLHSAGEILGHEWAPVLFPPYHSMTLSPGMFAPAVRSLTTHPRDNNDRGLVICSGGLDSTTVAKIAAMECPDVTLMHFLYNCQAQAREVAALIAIKKALQLEHPDVKTCFVNMDWLGALGGSPLTVPGSQITKGDAGAEFAHEWVPARNTAMVGIAASFADRYDIGRIYLGLNLEESGAYPDNTTEFFQEFNKVLAVGTQARPRIVNPLASLMKHEIVERALKIGAPIEHSWSCYSGGSIHCGDCGPCRMRRIAFQMLGREDMIPYAK